MDGGDVSLAIRRARRAGVGSIDLSHRGLRQWPEDLFSLRSIKVVDLSGNELSTVDTSIRQLGTLEELNLASNKLEVLPDLSGDILPNLRSLVLDRNPIASRIAPTTLRELASPPHMPGRTPAQVIQSLLSGATSSEGASPSRSKTKDLVSGFNNNNNDLVSGFSDGYAEATVAQASHALSQAAVAQAADAPAPAWLRGEEEGSAWRTQQKTLLKEVERLQARVNELEARDDQQLGADQGDLGGSSSVPSWLQKDKNTLSMSSTLPSRARGLTEDNEAADLKNQLREEQRKSKRLEKDVQRLTDRLSERDLSKGAVGSAPHFELHEVDLGDIINQGGFSVVHKGIWHSTKVAVKKIFDPKINEELLAEFDNEVQKLEQIRHPNILQLLAVHRKPPGLSLITELVEGGSYYQLIHAPHQFQAASGAVASVEQSEHMCILDSAAVALSFLHARGIIHRDVKSHNVLLSPHYEVKVCDFGLARMRSELMTGAMQFAGTPNYMSPEQFRQQRYTEKVDVFAFGTVLWEAFAQDIPFANLDPPDIREKVLNGQMLPMPSSFPRPVQALTQACWTNDQEARPFMVEVLRQLRECIRESSGAASRPRRPRTAGAVGGGRPSLTGSSLQTGVTGFDAGTSLHGFGR